jgi:hypothetical protein
MPASYLTNRYPSIYEVKEGGYVYGKSNFVLILVCDWLLFSYIPLFWIDSVFYSDNGKKRYTHY